MANILERYGIKEVADVTFYDIADDGGKGAPVLYLDTLKVSTIEQTAENTSARGGKGNAELIMWDYGKEINVTLEDALFSPKSMAIMFGNGNVTAASKEPITKTISWTVQPSATSKEIGEKPSEAITRLKTISEGKTLKNCRIYDVKGELQFSEVAGDSKTTDTALTIGDAYFLTGEYAADVNTIEISANSFPGTYYVEGETYARNEVTGDDDIFIFTIPKAKVQSENTITLEAEGDPSVFNMNLRVLRPTNGQMMYLKQFKESSITEIGTKVESKGPDSVSGEGLGK